MDLSFLDAFNSDSQLKDFVSDMFKVTIIHLTNSLPDISIKSVSSNQELDEFITEIFPDRNSVVQIIVKNSTSSKDTCPYFRLILYKWKSSSEVNYKLDSFMKSASIFNISPRCDEAVVTGLDPRLSLDNSISVPSFFCMTSLENINFLGDVDFECLPTSSTVLSQYRGTPLPDLPPELQWMIFSYLEHPTAAVIKTHPKWDILYYDDDGSNIWDSHFRRMARRPGFFYWQLHATRTFPIAI